MYADYGDYTTCGGTASSAEITPMLLRASDDIDSLTFSRIVAIGWDNLTGFQQSMVCRAVCAQADFLLENGDAVDSAMASYAINGVSMTFGNAALYSVLNGVAVSNRALAYLKRSGLSSLLAYPPEVDHALA